MHYTEIYIFGGRRNSIQWINGKSTKNHIENTKKKFFFGFNEEMTSLGSYVLEFVPSLSKGKFDRDEIIGKNQNTVWWRKTIWNGNL